MSAYYNEIDGFAVQWLRNLIAAGHIAPGDVDERSIEDVSPDDLRGYTQCHFFAGIGVWSAALRGVGWPDDQPIWSASCPCQGFSAAGKGLGFADERHLWPALFHLVDVCRPARLVGEQVASPLGLAWLDLVHADLEGAGYAVGAVDTCAAGFGAPHIRQRLYWMADAGSLSVRGRHEFSGDLRASCQIPGEIRRQRLRSDPGPDGAVRWLADAAHQQQHGRGDPGSGRRFEPAVRSSDSGLADAHHAVRGTNPTGRDQRDGSDTGWAEGPGDPEGRGGAEWLEHARLVVPGEERQQRGGQLGGIGGDQGGGGATTPGPSPLNGHWRDADWLGCRDGRWRPVEPGSRPLAHGITGRVGRLRAYGNAINKAQAEAFLACLP